MRVIRERETLHFTGALLFNRGVERGSLFDPHRSNQGTYRLLTHYKVLSYDIPCNVAHFEPNRLVNIEFIPNIPNSAIFVLLHRTVNMDRKLPV
jgi:hypothetical protein